MRTISSRLALALTVAITSPVLLPAQNGKPAPLIDREQFFGNPEISGAQIFPDGRYISFLKHTKRHATSGSNAPPIRTPRPS